MSQLRHDGGCICQNLPHLPVRISKPQPPLCLGRGCAGDFVFVVDGFVKYIFLMKLLLVKTSKRLTTMLLVKTPTKLKMKTLTSLKSG